MIDTRINNAMLKDVTIPASRNSFFALDRPKNVAVPENATVLEKAGLSEYYKWR